MCRMEEGEDTEKPATQIRVNGHRLGTERKTGDVREHLVDVFY
jgi:hypothetical protein